MSITVGVGLGGRVAGQIAQIVADAAAHIGAAHGLGLVQHPAQEVQGLLRVEGHVGTLGQDQGAGCPDTGLVQGGPVAGRIKAVRFQQGDLDKIKAVVTGPGNGMVATLRVPITDEDKRMGTKCGMGWILLCKMVD